MTSSITKHVVQEDMTRYSGPGNIHSDLDVAKRTGLDATIAQGMMTLAYASELMTRRLGERWLRYGSIEVTFVAPVYAGDDVTITARAGPDGDLEITAVNQHGATVMAGRARTAEDV